MGFKVVFKDSFLADSNVSFIAIDNPVAAQKLARGGDPERGKPRFLPRALSQGEATPESQRVYRGETFQSLLQDPE